VRASYKLCLPKYGGTGVLHPDIVYLDNHKFPFWLFYTPFPTRGYEFPCLVRSKDGINFTDIGVNNPLITNLDKDALWEKSHIADPDVVYDSKKDEWIMFYSGNDGDGIRRVLMAKSNNGLNWVRFPIPIVEGNEPTCIIDGSKIKLWYQIFKTQNSQPLHSWSGKFSDNTERVGIAYTEFSGNKWKEPKIVIKHPENSVFTHPDVLYNKGIYYMWILEKKLPIGLLDHHLRIFSSKDGINWRASLYDEESCGEGKPYRTSSVIVNDYLYVYKSWIKRNKRNYIGVTVYGH